ncbi:hypothetical protein [Microvirga massiliensis]|uniref:hypothetical protein n=1 Tax=Microvirga massiliensis TaxID=1033741 RepID=UPI00062B8557|nr:hypothetical protein [Microvirga massiliensis]
MRLVLTSTAVALFLALPAYADDRAACLAGIERLRTEVTSQARSGDLDDLQRTLRRAERELGERQFDECVEILNAAAGDNRDDDKGPETDDMFGFTQGTDVPDPGEFEISGEADGAFGKRFGRYRAGTFTSAFEFAPMKGLSAEFGVTASGVSTRNVLDLENERSGGWGSLSAELKWQALERGPSSPVGLTFIIEPEVAFRDEDEGERGSGMGLEARLALDTALVPDRVFAAVNLSYEIEKFRPRGLVLFNGEGEELEGLPAGPCLTNAEDEALENCVGSARRASAERSSMFGLSGALAIQAVPNVFVGAELRYLRAYDGLGLNRFEGHALFLGPTFYTKLTDQLSISAAFSTQIAGRAEDTPGRWLDLDNFSRHEAKLKISYQF